MLHHIFLSLFLFCSLFSFAQQTIYSEKDSLEVEKLLRGSQSLSPTENKILYFAQSFLDIPYQAATLEQQSSESLVVNLQALDCTTYIETVLALFRASESKKKDFGEYIAALQQIRYRNGVLDGYCSRLHYCSEWIQENERKGIVREITTELPHQIYQESLNYMSQHAENYIHLKNDLEAQKRIKAVEKSLTNISVPFVPKESVSLLHQSNKIKEGDIVMITTSIEGLDVTHMGFAIRKNEKLHLLHASSKHKKVLIDPLPLDTYVANGSKNTGIRLIRILP